MQAPVYDRFAAKLAEAVKKLIPAPGLDAGATQGPLIGHLAAHTTTIRLGTWVYVLPLRHPFAAARSFATLDVLSGGRAEVGVGVGWLEGEFAAAGVDFASRGRRTDEALEVCRRLWSEPTVEHHGEFFSFPPVAFEPKPIQRPWPRLHVGGESPAALRRAARFGGG